MSITTANEVSDVLDRLADSEAFARQARAAGRVRRRQAAGALCRGGEQRRAARLQAAQERVLQRLGLTPEGRKFVPHVTLARLRGIFAEELARFIALAGRFEPLDFPVGRFVLFSSRDSVGGGPYLVEQTYPLAP